MMRRRLISTLAVVALLGACSGDDDGLDAIDGGADVDDTDASDGDTDESTADTDASDDDTDPSDEGPDATDEGPDATDDGSETTETTESADDPDESDDDSDTSDGDAPISPTDDEQGSCVLDVTGDIELHWEGGGGASAIGYGPWIVAATGAENPLDVDDTFFIVNCIGDDGDSVNFLGGDTPIPQEPATYALTPGEGFLGQSPDDLISVLVGFDGGNDEAVYALAGPGEFVISEFDDDHIAGSFEFPVENTLAEMTGAEPSEALVTGTFDFDNPA